LAIAYQRRENRVLSSVKDDTVASIDRLENASTAPSVEPALLAAAANVR
jgi:hypothetical protein